MACSTGKVEHSTRESAFGHVRELEYKNSRSGNDLLSVGLGAYPCRECRHWHVGRRQIPTVYHYDVYAVVEVLADTGVLVPEKPRRLPKHLRRRHAGHMLALLLDLEEHAPMIWFTFNDAWDFSVPPHPGVFATSSAPHTGKGAVRIGVPASIITLRWHDYVQRNGPRRASAKAVAHMDRTDWLATDQPVPARLVRCMEAWYRGAWVDIHSLDGDAYDAWLAEPPTVE
jgi:hypothetical protein